MNRNFDLEIIRELSVKLAQCNFFARIYCHAHEISSNHENSNTISDNNDSAESNILYIVVSPSMRIGLIEGGDRCSQNLLTMEEISAVIPIEL